MPWVVSRRILLSAAAAGLAGCARFDGNGGTTTDNALTGDAAQLDKLELTRPAFGDGDPIPREYGRKERDVNPPLAIGGVPDDAASLVLVMDDPDAVEPAGKVWLHCWSGTSIQRRRRSPKTGAAAMRWKNDQNPRRSTGTNGTTPEPTAEYRLSTVR